MDIWIRNEVGYIDGYSLEEQPDLLKITVKKEPIDFFNWYWNGETLKRDVKNAPQPEPAPPTDIEVLQEENKELKGQISELMDAVLFISENIGGAN
ncbi:hypothetical protein JZO86_10805 [Enterococcus ureasiticus]|uniref:hypothetical protein n=1 Tax=Enterococcus ureasiticus TaxID=903984 RepID=UPI001A8E640B|nr:hypothetical protein [Enterococcus ureasiticus]MBO0474188.1 hypothetical protein [Enterococcus ureasiticus]